MGGWVCKVVDSDHTSFKFVLSKLYKNVLLRVYSGSPFLLITEEVQTTQMWKDKQQVIISRILKKDRQCKCERTNNRYSYAVYWRSTGNVNVKGQTTGNHKPSTEEVQTTGLWLPIVCSFTFTLSVLIRYTAYDYLLFVLSHLRCLYFFSIRLMITYCLSFHIYNNR
jgi:hypothetical protein